MTICWGMEEMVGSVEPCPKGRWDRNRASTTGVVQPLDGEGPHPEDQGDDRLPGTAHGSQWPEWEL